MEANRPTAPSVELIDAHIEQPRAGSRVLALQHGNVLVPMEWKSDSIQHFDAWCHYPKVPASVKARQAARFVIQKGE